MSCDVVFSPQFVQFLIIIGVVFVLMGVAVWFLETRR